MRKMELSSAAIVILSLLPSVLLAPSSSPDFNYVAMIDAGSSGSRMHVYKWLPRDNDDNNGVPKIEEVGALKVKPGLSSVADDTEATKDHLKALLKYAREKIPSEKYSETPIYLYATAGMRLVERRKRQAIFDAVEKNFEDKAFSPFKYSRANSRILSGEEEGAFTWITVNYLLGNLGNSSKSVKTTGILEMGGASAQIAFIPEAQILADKFPVKVGARFYTLYVHSYLYYGEETVIHHIQDKLVKDNPSSLNIPNPCMLKGDSVTKDIKGKTVTFSGSSDYQACANLIKTFMYKVPKEQCHPSPCTIGNAYQPPLVPDQFYAVQAYLYVAGDLKVLTSEGILELKTMETKAEEFCKLNLTEAGEQLGGNTKFASATCMMGAYVPILLHNGLGFPKTGNQIKAVKKIDGQATDWAVGAVLYEISRVCRNQDNTIGGAPTITNQIILLIISMSLAIFG